MFILCADKNNLTVLAKEPVTSGSVGVYQVQFQFSEDWNGLSKTAVFKAGRTSVSVLLDPINNISTCTIPWEAAQKHGLSLWVGIYGTRGGELILPSVWANLGMILRGAEPGETAKPPTPELWEQALAGKADGLDLDGQILSLLSGGKTLDSVSLPSGGGEGGGVSDHRLLSGRDAEKQHPINSIEGLAAKLLEIPEPVEALTNSELEALLV